MKTFILNESLMNGTVIMETIITVYQAENFKKAVYRLKNSLAGLRKNNKEVDVVIENNDSRLFSYIIKGQTFPVWGYMANKEHAIIEI